MFEDIPTPQLVVDRGYAGAATYLLGRIFGSDFDPVYSVPVERLARLDYLRKIAAGEVTDIHPKQILHWFASRFLMALAIFPASVNIIYEVATGEHIIGEGEGNNSVDTAILFLHMVEAGLQGNLVLGKQTDHFTLVDFSLPASFISKQIKQNKSVSKKVPAKAWVRYIQCLELYEENRSNEYIYNKVYTGNPDIQNKSDVVIKAVSKANKIVSSIFEGTFFSEM
jgi:hypothetical protein